MDPAPSKEPAPPFARHFAIHRQVEIEFAVLAYPLFNKHLGPHDPCDPNCCQVQFGDWAVRACRLHQAQQDDETKQMYVESIKPLISRFVLLPPVDPDRPNFLGYLSQPPSAAMAMASYAVWCTGPNNFGLVRVMEGPLLSAKKRRRVALDKGYRDELSPAVLDWYWRYGVWMDHSYNGGRPNAPTLEEEVQDCPCLDNSAEDPPALLSEDEFQPPPEPFLTRPATPYPTSSPSSEEEDQEYVEDIKELLKEEDIKKEVVSEDEADWNLKMGGPA